MANKMLLVSEDYITMLKQYGGKTQTQQEETTDIEAKKNVETGIIQSLPITYRNSGRALLDFFKEHCIEFDDKNQLVLNGETVPGTQITDLVHDLVRFRQSVDPPHGFYQLAEALAGLNVSRELIKNLQRQSYITNLREGTQGVPDTPENGESSNSAPKPGTSRKRKLNHLMENTIPRKKKNPVWLSY